MSSHALRLTSPPGDVNAIHDLLEEVWASNAIEPMHRFRFETALIELASNIFTHGLRDGAVTCSVTISASPDELSAEIVDDGVPAEVDLGREMPEESAESGRGLALVGMLVDSVEYLRRGQANRWRIAKTLVG